MAEKELVKQLSIKQPDSDTYITRDIGVDYQNVEGLDTDAEAAKAKKATGDKNGKDITSYVSSVTLGNDDALNIKDGTPNAGGTTYQLAMQGATGMDNGRRGFVPQPKAGDQGKVLKGNGTWDYSPANDNIAQKEVSPATAEHKTGDRIIFQGILYKVIDDIEIGDTLVVNSNIELSAPIADCMSEAPNLQDQICSNVEDGTTSAKRYYVGEYLVRDNKLYRVIDDISVGDSFTEDTNIFEVSTTEEITSLYRDLCDSSITEDSEYAKHGHPKDSYFIFAGSIAQALEDIAVGDMLTANGNFTITNIIDIIEEIKEKQKQIEGAIPSQFTNSWNEKTWNGLTNLNGKYTWTDGENIYYSNGKANQYVLDKLTSTWNTKTWNGFINLYGDRTWADEENIYYSFGANQYVLDKSTSTWNEKVWNGLTDDLYGDRIWTDEENIYYSHGTIQYVLLDKSTSTWSEKAWNGLVGFNGEDIWSDGENIYYSSDTRQYVLDKSTDTWNTKTWNGLTDFNGGNIWTNGKDTYYSYGTNQYILDKSTSTWSNIIWKGNLTNFNGDAIWTDGENIYYSYNTNQYVLDKEKKLGTAAGKDFTEQVEAESTDLVTSGAVYNAVHDTSIWFFPSDPEGGPTDCILIPTTIGKTITCMGSITLINDILTLDGIVWQSGITELTGPWEAIVNFYNILPQLSGYVWDFTDSGGTPPTVGYLFGPATQDFFYRYDPGALKLQARCLSYAPKIITFNTRIFIQGKVKKLDN